MKKFFGVFFVMIICFSAGLVSCGGDDPMSGDRKDPSENVEMGTYSIYHPDLTLTYWPDSEAGITEQFETYYNGILAALKVDPEKKYKWSDIEADRERLQNAFDGIGDFEYKVKSCRNYFSVSREVTFGAYKTGSLYPDIDFGGKKLTCKLDVPEDATCQLHIEVTSYETAVPSAKEYNTTVRTLFADALKDVFTEKYGVHENKTNVEYLNMVNYSGSREEISNRVKSACEGVKIPDLPENVRKDARDVTSPSGAKLSYILVINIFSYDPKSSRIIMSEEEIFSHRIKVN